MWAPRWGLHVHRPERVGGEQGERPVEGHRPKGRGGVGGEGRGGGTTRGTTRTCIA